MKTRKPPKTPVVQPNSAEGEEEQDDRVIAQAFRWSLLAIVLVASVAGGAYYWYNRRPEEKLSADVPDAIAERRHAPKIEIPKVIFRDVTKEAGISFVHENGASGQKLLPETMGSGCAFVNYNNDGHADLLFVNSTTWPWDKSEKTPATMALYKNDGSGNFSDVTAEAGLNVPFYGMGVACGDFDNDGWVDLFFTAVGKARLMKNDEGKFSDVTEQAGVAGSDTDWTTGAGWIDYDNDSDLDLIVCRYVRWSRQIDIDQDFRLVGVGRAYGPPIAFEGSFPLLYRNDGGKFTDVSAEAGIQAKNPATGVPAGKSLGLAPRDLDGDGWIDLVVANDTVQNFVFHNLGNGRFREIGASAGIAYDSSGNARGAMGIDAAHFRNDDSLAFAIGNFSNEMMSLYVSQSKPLQFTDESIATGLGPPTRLSLTFGLFFFDYDNDGRQDVLSANGHLEEDINKVQVSQHYEQPPHLFWNCGDEQAIEFLPVPEQKVGPDFVQPIVGRGSAYADIDGDGDLDVAVTTSGGPPRLLRNELDLPRHWLRLKLVGSKSNRDAIGAQVELKRAGEVLRRQVMPTRSYLSQSELPVTFGLGDSTDIDEITIRWPSGARQKLDQLELDKLHVIEEPR